MRRFIFFSAFALLLVASCAYGRRIGGTRSCPSVAIFCEDFEGSFTGKLEGNASISSRLPQRRGKGLHLTPPGGDYGRLMVENFRPAGNSFWGRLYLRVTKYPDAPNYSHWVVTELLSADSSGERIRPLNGQLIDEVGPGTNMWGVGSDGSTTGDWTKWKESAKVKDDIWECLEFQVEDSDSSVRVFIDGKNQPELEVSRFNHGGADNTTELVFPKFDKIWFGWWNFQDGTTPKNFDVYIDDIALAYKRIGC